MAPGTTRKSDREQDRACSWCAAGASPRPTARTEPSPGAGEGRGPTACLCPSVSNILKAATDEGESSHLGKPQKNVARSNHAVQNNSGSAAGLLRWKEVTEEEAER